MFVNRRTFSAMLAGAVATPRLAFAQAKDNCALYSGVGGQLTHYEVDFGAATLAKRAAVTLPGGIQYAWPHPSRRYLYVATSTGGVGIADEWLGNADSKRHWRDTHYAVKGPVVAQLQAAFADNWTETTGKVLAISAVTSFDWVLTHRRQVWLVPSIGVCEWWMT